MLNSGTEVFTYTPPSHKDLDFDFGFIYITLFMQAETKWRLIERQVSHFSVHLSVTFYHLLNILSSHLAVLVTKLSHFLERLIQAEKTTPNKEEQLLKT